MAEAAASQPLLRVEDVAVRFGGIVALDGVSFDVAPGQIVGLIGPNGAGKTTLFNCVSRLYDCQRGAIHFDGQPLLPLPRHRVAALGIGRTFQNVALFRTMSVLDNVMVGRHCRTRGGFLANALRLRFAVAADREAEERGDRALLHGEVNAVQHARLAVGGVQFLDFKQCQGRPLRVRGARALVPACPARCAGRS